MVLKNKSNFDVNRGCYVKWLSEMEINGASTCPISVHHFDFSLLLRTSPLSPL
jgi:hypothetical protein